MDGPSARYRGGSAFQDPASRALRGGRTLEGPSRDPVVRLKGSPNNPDSNLDSTEPMLDSSQSTACAGNAAHRRRNHQRLGNHLTPGTKRKGFLGGKTGLSSD